MKKFTFKSLLIAAALCLGTSVWAEDDYYNKTVYSQDFENATSYKTGWNVSSGDVAQVSVGGNNVIDLIQGGGSGNRTVSGNLAAMSDKFASVTDYVFEFDFGFSSANLKASTLTLNSDKGVLFTITNNCQNEVGVVTNASGENIANITSNGYIKACPTIFNHFKIISNAEIGTFLTITNGTGTDVINSVKINDGLVVLTSFGGSLGRAMSHFAFDNLELKIHQEGIVIDAPIFKLKSLNGTSRTYTITNPNGEGSIYYTKEVSETEPEVGAEVFVESKETSVDVTVSESGTIYAYVLHANGINTSSVISQVVDASLISLAVPTVSLNSGYVIDENSISNVSFTINAPNNENVLFKPETEKLEYTFTPIGGTESSRTEIGNGEKYTPLSNGILRIYASTKGYKESVFEIPVSNFYYQTFKTTNYKEVTDPTTLIGFEWGEPYSVTWNGWASGLTAYLETRNTTCERFFISNTNTISLVIGWGFVRGDQKTYGYRIRNAVKGNIIALKQNTSKGNDEKATSFKVGYCTSGSGKATEYITIYSDEGAAIQQMIDYIPMDKNIEIHVGSNGIATFTPSVALDFTNATNIKAYTATVSETTVTLTETKTVAAGEGVIIKSVNGGEAEETIAVTNPVTATEGNALVGTLVDIYPLATDETINEVTYTNYILNNGSNGIGFYKANNKKVAAGKAYLRVRAETVAEAKALTIVWNDGETTGIKDNYEFGTMNSDAATFDLSGRKVANPAKGLYIKNGKKFIVK